MEVIIIILICIVIGLLIKISVDVKVILLMEREWLEHCFTPTSVELIKQWHKEANCKIPYHVWIKEKIDKEEDRN